MKKTLFTAALACVLTLGGLVSYAQVTPSGDNSFAASASEKLYLKILPKASSSLAMNFAIKRGDADYQTLLTSEQISAASSEKVKGLRLDLGNFAANETFKVGVVSGGQFEPFVSSEPGYYTSVDTNSYYSLDFSETPFDGTIEVFVFGEPLPPSTVTLLVALAAGAAFLLYRNRKQRDPRTEQA